VVTTTSLGATTSTSTTTTPADEPVPLLDPRSDDVLLLPSFVEAGWKWLETDLPGIPHLGLRRLGDD
jgi:hypothetical protein